MGIRPIFVCTQRGRVSANYRMSLMHVTYNWSLHIVVIFIIMHFSLDMLIIQLRKFHRWIFDISFHFCFKHINNVQSKSQRLPFIRFLWCIMMCVNYRFEINNNNKIISRSCKERKTLIFNNFSKVFNTIFFEIFNQFIKFFINL